jgi:hypothetical protein
MIGSRNVMVLGAGILALGMIENAHAGRAKRAARTTQPAAAEESLGTFRGTLKLSTGTKTGTMEPTLRDGSLHLPIHIDGEGELTLTYDIKDDKTTQAGQRTVKYETPLPGTEADKSNLENLSKVAPMKVVGYDSSGHFVLTGPELTAHEEGAIELRLLGKHDYSLDFTGQKQ